MYISKNISSISQPSNGIEHPSPSSRPIKLNYCEQMQKNKPQSNNVAGGLMIMAFSGLQIGWGLWRIAEIDTLMFCSWYVAAMVGSIISTYLLNQWTKKNIYYLSGTIGTIGSILFISMIADYNYLSLLFGRIFSGLSYGTAYITTVTHAAENSTKEMRGRVLASINYMIMISIFTVSIYNGILFPNGKEQYIEFSFSLFTIGLFYCLLGLVLTPCLTYESIPFLLKRNREPEAFETMMKLRNETFETWTIRNDMQEMKLMVQQDKDEQWDKNIFARGNIRPLLILVGVKFMAVTSNNWFFNRIMMNFTAVNIDDVQVADYSGGILTGVRMAVALIPLFVMDKFSHKKLLTVSGAVSGVLLLILGMFSSLSLSYYEYALWLPMTASILYQCVVGVSIDPLQHILLGEAFSTSTKSYWSFTFVTIVEHLLQIFMFLSVTNSFDVVLYVFGIASIFASFGFYYYLPETRGMSLRQARDEFQGNNLRGIIYSRENTNYQQGVTY